MSIESFLPEGDAYKYAAPQFTIESPPQVAEQEDSLAFAPVGPIEFPQKHWLEVLRIIPLKVFPQFGRENHITLCIQLQRRRSRQHHTGLYNMPGS